MLLFAKAPVPGRVKTRLVPALGENGAARLAARMLVHAVGEARASGLPVTLLCEPGPGSAAWAGFLPDGVEVATQAAGDIGARMAAASAAAVARGEWPVLTGTDCPGLDGGRIAAMAAALETHDLAITPALDGGYVAIALRRFDARLFEGIAWSTGAVLKETLERAEALGWSVRIFGALGDVDEVGDLPLVPGRWLE